MEFINLHVIYHENGTNPLRIIVDGVENPTKDAIKRGSVLTLTDTFVEGDGEITVFDITPVFIYPTNFDVHGWPLTIFYPTDKSYTFWDRMSITNWAARRHTQFKTITARASR